MRVGLLIIVLVALSATVSAKKKGGKLSKCEKEAKQAEKAGEDGPECLENGKYKPKQCNDTICWCVDKKTGDPTFRGVQVPLNHEFNCRKRPKACLKDTLEKLLTDPSGDQPSCTRKGWYKPMQCEMVKGKQCRDRSKRQTGGKSRSKRHIPSVIPCDPAAVFGFDSVCDKTDTEPLWTMVDRQNLVTEDGEITQIELAVVAGALGRPLRIGVYEPTYIDCQFVLKDQFIWISDVNGGTKTITLDVADRMEVSVGDAIGITWTAGAVVKYKNAPGDNNYCEESLAFTVHGSTATLQANRHNEREYCIRYTIEGRSDYIGFEPVDRSSVDIEVSWTFVNKFPFPHAGQIQAIEFWAGDAGAGQEVRFGLYRPTVIPGKFTVERQLVYTSAAADFAVGFNRIELTGADIFDVMAEDQFGFSWLGGSGGVIDYELGANPSSKFFYHYNAVYDEIDPASYTDVMDDTYGNRLYSVRVELVECDPDPLTAKGSTCASCWCVNKKGKEKEGTRTTDVDSLDCDVM